MPRASDVTELLAASRSDGGAATDRLMTAVYAELRRIADAARTGRPADETLSTTSLVHEAYLKLVDGDRLPFDGRAHFFSAAARAMRQVVVDQARIKGRVKRGGGEHALRIGPDLDVAGETRPERLLALDEALARFEAFDERAARVVECRYFAGLSLEETADTLGLSLSTAKRDWAAARAWLHRDLTADA